MLQPSRSMCSISYISWLQLAAEYGGYSQLILTSPLNKVFLELNYNSWLKLQALISKLPQNFLCPAPLQHGENLLLNPFCRGKTSPPPPHTHTPVLSHTPLIPVINDRSLYYLTSPCRVGQRLNVAFERTPENHVYDALQRQVTKLPPGVALVDYTSTESVVLEGITGQYTPYEGHNVTNKNSRKLGVYYNLVFIRFTFMISP